jgi:alkanesulfonate monooxygenase SsuD/methylene tetrahydromethanopterin reductase-like flavin-dependent oxidoreductase (luciferase family)
MVDEVKAQGAPDDFPVMAYHNINIGSDRDECLAESQRFLDAYYGPVFSPPMVASWTAAGPPSACVDHLRDIIEQGATAITLRMTSWDQRGQFQRLVDEVLPAVLA